MKDPMKDPNKQLRNLTEAVNNLYEAIPVHPTAPYGPGNGYEYDPIRKQSVPIDPDDGGDGNGDGGCQTQACWDEILAEIDEIVRLACANGETAQCQQARAAQKEAWMAYYNWLLGGGGGDPPAPTDITETPIITPNTVDYLQNNPMPERPHLYHPTGRRPKDLQYNDDLMDWFQGWVDSMSEDQKEMLLWIIPKLITLQNIAP